ncbi:hypothetical protein PAECIP111893_04236 [Paenibacillus plantiphilus]|uniref:WG repeat-containing protein n=1 Tax=Paenibacillus plantiphilus TaxID=2905650 RepID=A0ABN8GVR0_9BACL|nr:WG repeat-containing protein [Paenibacillus plantiphilus]CAH1217220.1 hypothetical protein PAECIP111893_04236 [Paenibacillus plantiphilus]
MRKLSFTTLLIIAFALACTSAGAAFADGTVKGKASIEIKERLYRIEKAGKFGFINGKGKIVIEPKYNQVAHMAGNPVYVVSDGKQIYYDADGSKLFECPLNRCGLLSEGMVVYQEKVKTEDGALKTRFGYLNDKGEKVTEPIFHYASHFADGMARVNVGKASGYIDKTGKLVIPYRFSSTSDFSEGRAVVQLQADGKYAYIDKTGKVLTPAMYAHAGRFSDGAAHVYVNGKYGYIDRNGNMFLEPQFSAAWEFSEGLAAVERNGKTFYINKQGKKVIFIGGGQFSDGLAPAFKGQETGYIDRTGKFAIQPKFVWGDVFIGELAMVYIKSEKTEIGFVEGYINRMGQIVWTP